jgi:large subunit ribosomal protein L4
MKTTIYTEAGKEAGTIELPTSVFGAIWQPDLVHEVVVAMQANARTNSAHTKDRGEVRGGGKKPWKQKGTGRARHGSRRSPIWVGGGVAHGPRNERDYSVKINRKVKAKALASVLSKKATDNEVIMVEALTLDVPKTASMKVMLGAVAEAAKTPELVTKRKNAAVVVLPGRHEIIEKSFRNFGHVTVVQAKDVNPLDLLTYKYVIVADPNNTLPIFEKRVAVVTKTA